MITAVDTNILLDILIPEAPHGDVSEQLLINSLKAGSVIISEAVYAELAAHFPVREQMARFLEETDIHLGRSGAEALYLAGKTWREYLRRRSGSALPGQHVVVDFLIGAHASLHSDRLLTRDRGYYHTYFPDLPLV